MIALAFVPDRWLVAAISGGAIYVSREIAQREIYGRWDWPGLLAPVAAVACAYFLIKVLT